MTAFYPQISCSIFACACRCTAPSRQAVNQMRQMDSRQKEQRLTGDELASLDGSMAARAMQWPRKGSLNLCGVPARLGGDGFANPLSNLPSREAQHEDPLASPEPTDPRDCPTPQVARSVNFCSCSLPGPLEFKRSLSENQMRVVCLTPGGCLILDEMFCAMLIMYLRQARRSNLECGNAISSSSDK